MLLTLLGIVILVKLAQNAKALPPILVTLFGIDTLVRPAQLWKALPPMLVIPFGSVTAIRLLHPKHTKLGMLVTLPGIVMVARACLQNQKRLKFERWSGVRKSNQDAQIT